jgi:hypothetical protein
VAIENLSLKYGAVNEKSVAYLTVKFKDKTGALAAPASATWEVHDVESGSELLAATAIAPIANTVELTLTPTINTFVNSQNTEEVRRVTIKATWGVSNTTNAEVDYNIVDLTWVSG